MKTLFVFYEWSGFIVSIQNHIISALEELEIETKVCHVAQLEETSLAFNPTMTIHFHPNKLIYEYMPVIRSLGGHRTLWDMESPYESDIVFDAAPDFHNIFCSDIATTKELQKAYPDKKIFYVPHAYNPKVHKYSQVPYEYRSDILFVGNAYESRLKWFRDHSEEYKDKLVTIIGVGYRGLPGYSHQRIIHDHVSQQEMVKYINGANLVLNLHRQNSDLDMANSRGIIPDHYNNRFYEVSACRRYQQVIGRPDTHVEFSVLDDTYVKRLEMFYLDLLK